MTWFRNKISPSVSCETVTEYFKNTGNSSHKICNAPYTALYFTPDGLIRPCCAHSDLMSFGNYPETSISSALNSANRKMLQRHIRNNSLAFGCQPCLKNISSGNYRGSLSSLYDKYTAAKYPEIIDFELSHFCNLNCVMCYLHTTQPTNDEIYGSRFLKELQPYLSRVRATRFYGGEPFLIKIYHDIWNSLLKHNKECQVHIQTNGSVFNPTVEALINQLNVFLGISIDALTPELYEKIRVGASFSNLMKNAEKFNEMMRSQGKSLTFSFCPMPVNWQEIPAMFRYADAMKSLLFFNTVSYPPKHSFDYLPGKAIQEISLELKKFTPQTSDNPHQERNFSNLQNLIQSLDHLAEAQTKAERDFQHIPLRTFLSDISKRMDNTPLMSDFIELIADFDMRTPISPYLQANISQMSPKEIVQLLSNKTFHKDVSYFKNIFQTDPEPNHD